MDRFDIQSILDQISQLNEFGIGLFNGGHGLTEQERYAELWKSREALLEQEDICNLIVDWLQQLEPTKTINRRHSSYGLKHFVEVATGYYISNGAFIVAAIHCCFPYKIQVGRPNVLFGISERSLKRLKEYAS